LGESERGPAGDQRIVLVAEAFQLSGLLNGEVDVYGDDLVVNIPAVQSAASEAYKYLAAESPSPPADGAVIDMRTLTPHIIAMANLLRGYAEAAGRPYSGYQRRDWKLIVGRLVELLLLTNGQTRHGYDFVGMSREYRARIRESMMQDLIDIRSSRFFEGNAWMDSPSGDLDLLLSYIVAHCSKTFRERKMRRDELVRDQKVALDEEKTTVGYGMRWLGQRLFGGV
jgi:hypothetical protein